MMRQRLLVLVVVAAFVMLAVPVAAAPPDNPFVGSWESPDPFDGSQQHVAIGDGPNLPVWYVDDAATACENAGFGFVPAGGTGSGVILGETTLEFTVDIYCQNRGPGGREFLFTFTFEVEYDSATDTLTDLFGGCWYRSGNPAACAP